MLTIKSARAKKNRTLDSPDMENSSKRPISSYFKTDFIQANKDKI